MRSRALASTRTSYSQRWNRMVEGNIARSDIPFFFQILYWFRQRSEGEGAEGTFGLHS